MNYFVTAIDTDSGKTLVSAILCEALGFNYWKPIQAGYPKDSDTIRSLIRNPAVSILPETFTFTTPASPHAAAKIDGIQIDLNSISLPKGSGNLVIEGAGGCLVPINDSDFVIDIGLKFNAEIIIVSDLYLGSINHTLLTAALLKQRNAKVKGIIFNGDPNEESERIILQHTQYPFLLRINTEPEITHDVVKRYASILKLKWND